MHLRFYFEYFSFSFPNYLFLLYSISVSVTDWEKNGPSPDIFFLFLSFQLLRYTHVGLIGTLIAYFFMCLLAPYSLSYELPVYIFPHNSIKMFYLIDKIIITVCTLEISALC